MRLFLLAANTAAALISLMWLWGNSNDRASGWQTWFALGYLLVTVANVVYLVQRGRRVPLHDPMVSVTPPREEQGKVHDPRA